MHSVTRERRKHNMRLDISLDKDDLAVAGRESLATIILAVKDIAMAGEMVEELPPKRKRKVKNAPESPTTPSDEVVDTIIPTDEENAPEEPTEAVDEEIDTPPPPINESLTRKDLVEQAKEISIRLDSAEPIKNLLTEFGVKQFSELPEEQFLAFKAALEGLEA